MIKVVQQNELGFSLSALLEGIIPSPPPSAPPPAGGGGNLLYSASLQNCKILGLSTDSRQIQQGDLFIACKGEQADGRDYIENAIDRGAVAVLAEGDHGFSKSPVLMIQVPRLSDYIGFIAARFYGDPSKYLRVVGFTGTNGKTSCTQFMAQALSALHKSCGIIGTLGAGFLNDLKTTGLTTPCAVMLQKQLALLRDRGAEMVAMEASSHGLFQGRTQGVLFDTAVFTNLTTDHLDYHKTMEDYASAKKQLFLQPGLRSAVFNMDDPYGRELAEEFRHKLTVYGYSIEQDCAPPPSLRDSSPHKGGRESTVADISMILAQNIQLTAEGFEIDVVTPWGSGQLSTTLLGRFNISNLLAILAVLGIMGTPLEEALKSLAPVKTVSGRMEVFGGGKQPLVVIDYAHTPDALEKALLTLKDHCHRKLWCVFGCGGNRDATKRKLMGQIAEQYSDQLVITDDNPRFEDAEQIINDIIAGLLCPWAVEIEHDRGAAIAHAIQSAVSGDVILIAGKGHEDYQLIGGDSLPFNDAEQVCLQLSLRQ